MLSVASVIDVGQGSKYSIDITQRNKGLIVSHGYYESRVYGHNITSSLMLENLLAKSSINLTVVNFDLGGSESCSNYLDISGLQQSPMKICQSNYSSSLNREFKVRANKITFHFVSDSSPPGRGFLIQYEGQCKVI